MRREGSEPQTIIFLPTSWTNRTGLLALQRVKAAAPHAVKRNVSALGLKAGVIATVVVNPKAKKQGGDEETVDDRGGDEIHAVIWRDRLGCAGVQPAIEPESKPEVCSKKNKKAPSR
jgi:hypothetical protein